MKTELTVRKIEEMREVARSSVASAKEDGVTVEEAYYVIHHPGMNITVLPEYRLGEEYPKTYGHFHQPEAEETYEVLLGEAGILLQKGVDPAEEVRLIRLKKGDSFTVPEGYAHSLINLGKGSVVTLDDHDPARFNNDYEPIRGKHGFAYYIVEKNGKPEAVPNPNYKKVPRLEILNQWINPQR